MAIIYSYPKVTSPLATDVLVLTDTTLTAGKRKNKTKSLAMSDLAAYVVSSTSGITGGGTFNTIPLWTPDGTKLGDSIITQAAAGQGVTVTGGLDVTEDLSVTGSTNINDLDVVGVSAFNEDAQFFNPVNFDDAVSFKGTILDQSGNPGTAGQVLSSTGADIQWINNGGGGGTGTTNTLTIFTDGPGGVLGDSIITQAASGQGVAIEGGLDITEDLNVTGSIETSSNLSVNGDTTFFSTITAGGGTGTAGQVLSSTGTGVEWVDPSAAITKLIPYFQLATPGGSDTYTQLNNVVDFDWSGGSGTYEYILPSAAAIPYRTIRFVNNSTITASDKIRITAPGTETIDGGAFYEINKPYNGCAVWSDGVQWIVIQAKA